MSNEAHNVTSARQGLLNIKPKFREKALVATVRNQDGIAIYIRKDKDSDAIHGQPIVLMFADASDANRKEAEGYGWEVRLTRAAAIEHAKSGRPATAQERYEAIEKLANHYASGTDQWNMAGGGGGGLNSDTKALIEALVRALGLDSDTAEAQVRAMSGAERDALRQDEEIKPHLEAVYAERAKTVDTKGLLAKLKAL